MPKGFVSLGRGMTINKSLVKEIVQVNNRYFVKGVYGESYQVDEKHYKKAIKEMER